MVQKTKWLYVTLEPEVQKWPDLLRGIIGMHRSTSHREEFEEEPDPVQACWKAGRRVGECVWVIFLFQAGKHWSQARPKKGGGVGVGEWSGGTEGSGWKVLRKTRKSCQGCRYGVLEHHCLQNVGINNINNWLSDLQKWTDHCIGNIAITANYGFFLFLHRKPLQSLEVWRRHQSFHISWIFYSPTCFFHRTKALNNFTLNLLKLFASTIVSLFLETSPCTHRPSCTLENVLLFLIFAFEFRVISWDWHLQCIIILSALALVHQSISAKLVILRTDTEALMDYSFLNCPLQVNLQKFVSNHLVLIRLCCGLCLFD